MQRSCSRAIQTCLTTRPFSTTIAVQARRTKSHPALPVPSRQLPRVAVPDNHALWQFFRTNRQTMTPPTEDAKHGRPWTSEELRKKSFDDLHSLWIICLKERNILATQRHERRRQRIPTAGKTEATERDRTVRRTMAGIKFVLTERLLAYQSAVELAKKDESIGLQPETEADTSVPQTTASGHVKSTESNNELVERNPRVPADRKSERKKLLNDKREAIFRIKTAEIARSKQVPVNL